MPHGLNTRSGRDLYRHFGRYLHHRIKADEWTKRTAYPVKGKLSTLLRELPWSARLEYQLVEQPAIGPFAESKSLFRLHKWTCGVSGLHKLLTQTNGPKRAHGLLPRLLSGQIDVEDRKSVV